MKDMNIKKQYVLFLVLGLGFLLFGTLLMQVVEIWYGGVIAILHPQGAIAFSERNLLFLIQGIMLIVVLPVFSLMFLFIWKYRADNTQAKYTPDWDDHRVAEYIWWGLPFVIILVISIFTWTKTHELDPFKPLDSEKKPLTIQVVALQWKWLFLYPEHNVASLNFLQFPKETPLHFEITADAPMNSFWIPQLGGQVYAMPSMKTQLHLIAQQVGQFRGSSANISGKGFAGMHFMAHSTTQEEFDEWIQSAQKSKNGLTFTDYLELAKPSENEPPALYLLKENSLFDQIVMKYMMPEHTLSTHPMHES